MVDNNRGYQAYLIRLWQARSGGQVVWRASAQDAHSGQRHAFAGLAQLFAFLEEAAGQQRALPTEAGGTMRSNQHRGERRT